LFIRGRGEGDFAPPSPECAARGPIEGVERSEEVDLRPRAALSGNAPATVDGPSAIANFSGLGTVTNMRICPQNGSDPFKAFTGKGARYFDNVVAWPSVEPADDYTALTVLVFAGEEG